MTFDEATTTLDEMQIQSIMTREEREYLWDLVCASRDHSYFHAIEVGTAYGGTAALLAMAGATIHAVDSGVSGQWAQWELNMQRLQHLFHVEPMAHKLPSLDAERHFDNGHYHLVIVDANHDGDEPYKDLCAWARKVRHGGILFLDDVGNSHPAVLDGMLRWIFDDHDHNADHFTYVRSFVSVVPGGGRYTKGVVFQRK